MTSRQRMLTAYRNQQPDVVPVSPELWYDIPLVIAGVPFEEVCLGRYPVWTFQLQAHAFFGSDAWIVPFPGPSAAGPAPRVLMRSRFSADIRSGTVSESRSVSQQ